MKIDLPPKQELQILVKLSTAQHMIYRHLLVNQGKATLESIMAEAGKFAADGGGDGGGADGNRSVSPAPSAGAVSSSGASSNGAGDGTKAKKMNDSDYRKLMNLLLQLR